MNVTPTQRNIEDVQKIAEKIKRLVGPDNYGEFVLALTDFLIPEPGADGIVNRTDALTYLNQLAKIQTGMTKRITSRNRVDL